MNLRHSWLINIVIFLISAIAALSVSARAGESEAIRDFIREEQRSWQNYIERFREYRADSTFDVTFYYLNVDIAVDSEFIVGDVRCRFTSRQDGLNSIKLNFVDSLPVDSITGDAASFTRAEDTITIVLSAPLNAGDSAEVHIYYQGVPPVAGGIKGLNYETHGSNEIIIATLSTPFLAHYWWPCKDGPGDKPDSVYIDITIPDTVINGLPLIATSNGTLDSVYTDGIKKTYQWRERYPIVTYYVMAAISNYLQVEESYSGPGGDFPLDYYIFSESQDSLPAGTAYFSQVVDYFSTLFGPYPFNTEKYAISEIGFYGGIENQTNTIQGKITGGYFSVTVHEFSHMWFGDMITCKDWHHGWLNEGFARYCENLWTEHRYGIEAARQYWRENKYYGGGTLYLDDISDPFDIFISIIYTKGAWVLHMLRWVLGDDIFFDCLYAYANDPELRYGHATTEDLQNICENVSGQDLDWFFQEWVYGTYYPIYEFSWHTRHNPDPNGPPWQTFIYLEQSQTTDPQLFEMPVGFQLWLGATYSIQKAFSDQRQQNFLVETNFKPDSIIFDPHDDILNVKSTSVYTTHIISDSIAGGNQAEQYSDTLTIISQNDGFDVEIASGALPEGWTLDATNGIISGVSYDTAGIYSFTITAVDDENAAYFDTRDFTVMLSGTSGPGDANLDGGVDVGDAVFIINFVFKSGSAPEYPNWADVNADCAVNVGDAVYLINYIFKSGMAPQMGCVE